MSGPAEPILASAIWTTHIEQANTTALSDPCKVNTGHDSIDDALTGGLEFGSTCAISAEIASSASELAQAFLISHLSRLPSTTATYIDSAQGLDVRKLYRAMTARINVRGKVDNADEIGLQALNRLKIMRVFDFVGLTESIAEVRDSLDPRNLHNSGSEEQHPRGTIGDSQANDEDEMLDSPPTPLEAPHDPITEQRQDPEPASLLIIDNLPSVIVPLTKANLARGTSVLQSFLRSLAHLTRAHNLCTILLNTGNFHVLKDESPSIFGSCALRPLLGRSFTYVADVHLLVHLMPKTKADAQAAFGKGRNSEMVNVVEVWKDRDGGRVGRWAAFQIGNDGTLEKA